MDKIKVLIVDDECIIRDGIAVLVDWSKYGYEIFAKAGNGNEAVKILKENKIDLVLTDIKMPEMDGLELSKYIFENISKDIKIVIVSGFYDFEYAKQAIKFNVCDYILKPINKEELIDFAENFASNFFEGDNINLEELSTITQNKEDLSSPKATKSLLKSVEEEIRRSYMTNLTLKDLGEKFFINSVYLGQIFKKEYGITFKEYLNNHRIDVATEILVSTDSKIYEIAEQVGYLNTDYFINTFVKRKGKTPHQYRVEIKKL